MSDSVFRFKIYDDSNSVDDEMDELVVCKYCGGTTTFGELTWLNGKCMCPRCYMSERAKEDAKLYK